MTRQDELVAQLECECDNLRQKVAYLEHMLQELQSNRVIPQRNSWVVPQWAVEHTRCQKCNLELKPIMSYSCPDGNCPCGLGSIAS